MTEFGAEAEAVLKRIATAINAAMPAVGADIKACIAEHVENDVYANRSAKVYPPSGNLLRGALEAAVTAGGGHVIVAYEPNPQNTATWGKMPKELMQKYRKRPNDPVKEDAAPTPDAFIRRVETGDYPFNTAGAFGRPFFTNATEELIEGKRALATFIAAVNSADAELRAFDAGDVEIMRDANDVSEF